MKLNACIRVVAGIFQSCMSALCDDKNRFSCQKKSRNERILNFCKIFLNMNFFFSVLTQFWIILIDYFNWVMCFGWKLLNYGFLCQIKSNYWFPFRLWLFKVQGATFKKLPASLVMQIFKLFFTVIVFDLAHELRKWKGLLLLGCKWIFFIEVSIKKLLQIWK